MTDPENDNDFVDFAANLLTYYSFDLAGATIDQLIEGWIQRYPSKWLMAAVIEALYQGRYKAVSVGQILAIWSRRGQPISHYNSEFERMVCDPISLGVHTFPSTHSLQTEPDSQAEPISQATPDHSTHQSSIESPGVEPPINTQAKVQTESGQTEPDQVDLQQSTADQPDSGRMRGGAATVSSDFAIQEAITPHFEKAERFLHPLHPLPHPPENRSKSVPYSPPEKRVRPTNGGYPEDPFKERDASSMNDANGFGAHSHIHTPADDRLDFRKGLPPESIHKFVPTPKASNFYARLRAMASRRQSSASLSQPERSEGENAPSSSHPNRSPNGAPSGSSNDMSGDIAGDTATDSGDASHSHLETIHLPPQPDLEAIAESLYQESLHEEALKRKLSAAQFQSSKEVTSQSESNDP